MNRFRHYLLAYIQTQLIITLFSLPLLIHWGLGISWMSIVSNFIFSPILTGFIIMSSLLFFTELVGLPNYPFVWLLEQLVWLWDSCLHRGSKNWLIHCAHPGTIFLLMITGTTYFLLKTYRFKSVPKQIGFLGALLIIMFAVINFKVHFSDRAAPDHPHPLQTKFLVTQNNDTTINFIDRGYFNTKSSPDKAISFELKPFLTKKFGQCIINELTLIRPTMRSFWGARELCNHFIIKKICIPFFEHQLSKKAWHQFFMLKETCTREKITLKRFK